MTGVRGRSPLYDAIRYEALALPGTAALAVAALPAGSTVTVTCSPTRGLEPTVALCEELAGCGLVPVPHLAARQVLDVAHLKETLRRLEAAGIRDVFVVGGDAAEPAGPYRTGHALLAAISEISTAFTRIGIPAYPDGHPHIDPATLLADLRAKQVHATYMVTQLCFDPAVVLDWLLACRRAGVRLPAFVGLPGVVQRSRLLRSALRIGVRDATRYLNGNRVTARRMLSQGAVEPDLLAGPLEAALGPGDRVAGAHLFTFNQFAATAQWVTTVRGQ